MSLNRLSEVEANCIHSGYASAVICNRPEDMPVVPKIVMSSYFARTLLRTQHRYMVDGYPLNYNGQDKVERHLLPVGTPSSIVDNSHSTYLVLLLRGSSSMFRRNHRVFGTPDYLLIIINGQY